MMAEQDLEELMDALSRGIVNAQYQGPHQEKHLTTLKRLVTRGEQALAPIQDWTGVPSRMAQLVGQVEMGRMVVREQESRRERA